MDNPGSRKPAWPDYDRAIETDMTAVISDREQEARLARL